MGADINFSDGSYYRDPYNPYNLAWVIGESYWKNFSKNKTGFMKKLSKITDAQIESYVKREYNKKGVWFGQKPSKDDWARSLRESRDELVGIFSKKNVKVTFSSV